MNSKRLAFDVVVLLLYLACANPAATGIPVHEWLGIAVLLVVVMHAAVGLGLFAKKRKTAWVWGSLVVDVCMAVALMLCFVSGLMISGTVLQTFGLYAEGYYFWDPLHATSAKAFLALLLVHIALHARMIAAGFKKSASKG